MGVYLSVTTKLPSGGYVFSPCVFIIFLNDDYLNICGKTEEDREMSYPSL